tara:strand:- start:46 stop:711 length:666 start_codon:yes stop_codon:yes gene_type:complete
MSLSKLKWQQRINQLRFLHKELKLVKTVASDIAQDFQEYYENYCAKRGINIAELNAVNKTKVDELFGVDAEKALLEDEVEDIEVPPREQNEVDKAFNKVFKQLAFHLHPDRFGAEMLDEEKEEKIEKFREALDALENKRYFTLMDYAEQYKIEVPVDYELQQEWLKKEIASVKAEIQEGKETYTYRFFECEEDGERDTVIKRFLRHLFGYEVDEPDIRILK